MKRFEVCGVYISAIDLSAACAMVSQWIKNFEKKYVCVVPVSTVIACQSDSLYRTIVNEAGMATPDGMPIVWLGRMKGYKEIKRTYGPDFMLAACAISEEKGYRHFFYGGSEETSHRLEEGLRSRFPYLKIVGRYAPPFRNLSEIEEREIISFINEAKPDVLWIGLGSPKQDYWMYTHRAKLEVPVMVGVGAAFDFLAGTKPQAPRWMQRAGLEWFFRLCCEPRRLWKRYLFGNSKFIYIVVRDLLKSL